MGSVLYLNHFCTTLDRELRHVPEICWSHSQSRMLLLPLGPLWTFTSVPLVPSDPTAFHVPSLCNCCLLGLPHLLQVSSSAPCQQPLSGWLANKCLSVRNLRSHRFFTLLLSTSLQDFWSSNMFATGVTVHNQAIQ